MAESGSLHVRVFTSRAQIPVVGAAVAVTRKTKDGKHELLFLRETDENGRIPPLFLPAPPTAESVTPGDAQPFSTCDVWAEHPAFELVHIEHVQIFPRVATEQNIELIPLPEFAQEGELTQTVDITPQPL